MMASEEEEEEGDGVMLREEEKCEAKREEGVNGLRMGSTAPSPWPPEGRLRRGV